MGRLLLIVSRAEPTRYAYLRHVFGNETVDVILDRRVSDRRQRQEPAKTERRRGYRRHRYITQELKESGWAMVRR